MGTAAGDVSHPFGLEVLYQTRLITIPATEMTQLPVIPLAPGENFTIRGQGQGMTTTCVEIINIESKLSLISIPRKHVIAFIIAEVYVQMYLSKCTL